MAQQVVIKADGTMAKDGGHDAASIPKHSHLITLQLEGWIGWCSTGQGVWLDVGGNRHRGKASDYANNCADAAAAATFNSLLNEKALQRDCRDFGRVSHSDRRALLNFGSRCFSH